MPRKYTPRNPCAEPGCVKKDWSRGYCRQHVALHPHRLRTLEERFWSKVDRNGPIQLHMETPCWVWTADVDSKGYGRFVVKKKRVGAQRHSWILTSGAILNGLHVLHECDHPLCCNPAHLFLGTQLDNVRDMIAKGRARLDCAPQGERHGLAKLTEEIVREARRRYAAGESGRSLAREYDVSISTMCRAINGETWGRVI